MPTDYDAMGEAYASIADEMPGNKYWERPATLALLPSLDGLEVLDAGCGAGFYSEFAAKAGAHVIGYDPSVVMVDHARRRLGASAELHHCCGTDLPNICKDKSSDR